MALWLHAPQGYGMPAEGFLSVEQLGFPGFAKCAIKDHEMPLSGIAAVHICQGVF